MADRVTHPLAPEPSRSDRRVERINSASFRYGLLGVLGFLESLQFVSPYFEVAQLFYLFFLLFFVPFVVGFLQWVHSLVRATHSTQPGADAEDAAQQPASWVESGYEPSAFKTLQSVSMMVHPTVLVQGSLQVLGNVAIALRYRGHPPTASEYESDVDYRLPFDGEWTVVNGSPDRWYSHCWYPAQQRYAYDFVVTDDEDRTHDGSGGVESFYCFGEPILAPADGTVVAASDGHRDYHRTSGWLDPLQYRIFGNYVVVEHATDEYSVLAHLQQGSVCVEEGDQVARGQRLGRCGHSGNSTEPHLHFHVQDHANLYLGMGLPVEFAETTTVIPDGERSQRERTYVHSGQRVSYEASTVEEATTETAESLEDPS